MIQFLQPHTIGFPISFRNKPPHKKITTLNKKQMHGALGCSKGKIIEHLEDKVTAKWEQMSRCDKGYK